MSITLAELAEVHRKTEISLRELMETSKETERKMAASRAETERAIKEARAETERHQREIRAEMAASRAETERAMKESADRVDRAIDRLTERIDRLSKTVAETSKVVEETSKTVAETSENVGNVNNNLGKFTEIVVIPGIRREINAQGHDFKRSYANKKVWVRVRENKRLEAEVDLFLTNGAEAMAVEIKTTLKSSDVTKHIRQLEKLRKCEVEAGVQGKELYGALAGVYVDADARKLALKNGLYVLEIIEEEEKLKTAAPKLASVW